MSAPKNPPSSSRNHPVALWAGVASFFGSLLAIGTIELLNPGDIVKFFGSVLVAVITGGSVYAHERLEDAKHEREGKL